MASLNIRTAFDNVLDHAQIDQITALSISELITTDDRFNDWFALVAKLTLNEDALLNIIDLYDDYTTECLRAIDEFLADGDSMHLKTTVISVEQKIRVLTSDT